ncbi:MAG: HD domain-containing protein [Betaproteobacteria bacterium]|nr:HD domain-containing protein [Betaproteobacteria bacterium]
MHSIKMANTYTPSTFCMTLPKPNWPGQGKTSIAPCLIETTNTGYVVIDTEGRVIDANAEYVRLTGYRELKQIIGRSVIEWTAEYETDKNANAIAQCARDGQIRNLEIDYTGCEGRITPIEVNATVVTRQGQIQILSLCRDISQRRLSEHTLLRAVRALKTLSSCNRILVHARDEHHLLSEMCRNIVEQGGYRMCWVGYAEHDEKQSIRPMISAGHNDGYIEMLHLTWSDTGRYEGPTAQAIRSGQVVVVRDIANEPSFAPWREAALARGYRACIAFPLKPKEGVAFGGLVIYSAEANTFSHEELDLLEELAEDLSFGIHTLRTHQERDHFQKEHQKSAEQLRESLFDTIRAISLTVEKRDPYTAGHQSRVAQLATAIAGELGMDADRIEGLRLGGMIHDIGKIYVPAEILNRPGRLTHGELEIIRSHPEVGYEIIKDVKFPWPVADMVLQHHERLDGSGYPHGLKGDEIILEARILSVADVVEAITSHRPYRPAIGIEAGLAEIEAKRDQIYDPDVVDACLRLFREKGYVLEGAGLK